MARISHDSVLIMILSFLLSWLPSIVSVTFVPIRANSCLQPLVAIFRPAYSAVDLIIMILPSMILRFNSWRGRDAGCPAPPSQIPAGSFPAPGSSEQLTLMHAPVGNVCRTGLAQGPVRTSTPTGKSQSSLRRVALRSLRF